MKACICLWECKEKVAEWTSPNKQDNGWTFWLLTYVQTHPARKAFTLLATVPSLPVPLPLQAAQHCKWFFGAICSSKSVAFIYVYIYTYISSMEVNPKVKTTRHKRLLCFTTHRSAPPSLPKNASLLPQFCLRPVCSATSSPTNLLAPFAV